MEVLEWKNDKSSRYLIDIKAWVRLERGMFWKEYLKMKGNLNATLATP
jgi:hypothetical protein